MAENIKDSKRYFWKSYELTPAQARAVRTLGDDVFEETPQHPRDDDFIRKAWK